MREKPPIIWIEADRPPARYFLNSINIHQELFPNRRKIVVTNSRFAREYRKYPVEIIEIESVKPSNLTIKFESIKKRWKYQKLQHVYWINTTKRFFYLFDTLISLEINKGIHIESDNILFDLKFLDLKLKNNYKKIYYPKQSNHAGCASVFLVGNLEALDKFLYFICSNWKKPYATDMTLLSEFESKSNFAEFLPSARTEQFYEKVFFDAGTIGRYFLGTEARHYRFPMSKRGIFDKSNGSLSPEYFKISLDKTKKPQLNNIINDKNRKLQNLHIHSKRIPSSSFRLFYLLNKESSTSRNFIWRFGTFDFRVALERIVSFTYKNLLKSNRDFRLR